MPSIYDLKPRFQALLRPLVKSLAEAGVTANHVTVTALVLSFIVGALIALFPAEKWPLLLMPLVLFVRMALNAIDGMLAREYGMKSSLGAILNELGDVLSDTALYLPLGLVPGVNSIYIVAITILAIVSEMTGVIAVQIGAQRRYDGPMGKSDRAFAFGLLCLLLGIGIQPVYWVDAILLITLGLLLVTIVNRARRALAEVG
ncbi:MAG TPA: CDP-alcohol phosphatidyltransferase family protein [Candidatus Binatia bacterium]|jgi:CDP-diacylglycerol--glycerol-3-phosphate 3-phosphatidyltransferase|nr:CDP-alcohol phosphatidyltransferase family protein [Candidatus Binatia bacterium]